MTDVRKEAVDLMAEALQGKHGHLAKAIAVDAVGKQRGKITEAIEKKVHEQRMSAIANKQTIAEKRAEVARQIQSILTD